MSQTSTNVQHDHWLLEQLKDAQFAAEFLNAASEDDIGARQPDHQDAHRRAESHGIEVWRDCLKVPKRTPVLVASISNTVVLDFAGGSAAPA